jgi:hypothetical protein
MLKLFVIYFFFLYFNIGKSQIIIDDVGDDWKHKVEKSLSLIKHVDPVKYDTLIKYCYRITFWNGKFSTTEDSKTIMLSQTDMLSNNINNISSAIVHESYHLKFYNETNDKRYEEHMAYKYELDFLKKIKNIEPWLIEHAIKMIKRYE